MTTWNEPQTLQEAVRRIDALNKLLKGKTGISREKEIAIRQEVDQLTSKFEMSRFLVQADERRSSIRSTKQVTLGTDQEDQDETKAPTPASSSSLKDSSSAATQAEQSPDARMSENATPPIGRFRRTRSRFVRTKPLPIDYSPQVPFNAPMPSDGDRPSRDLGHSAYKPEPQPFEKEIQADSVDLRSAEVGIRSEQTTISDKQSAGLKKASIPPALPSLLAAFLLFTAASVGDAPFGFFLLLRFIVCGIALYTTLGLRRTHYDLATWVYGGLAVLSTRSSGLECSVTIGLSLILPVRSSS
jgi:hypothetical protein